MCENRMLKRIFEPKRWAVTGGWKKPHEEEFHNLFLSPIIIKLIKSRKTRLTGHVACMEDIKKCTFGKTRCRWNDNTKIYVTNKVLRM
jgi:hypothetical protein